MCVAFLNVIEIQMYLLIISYLLLLVNSQTYKYTYKYVINKIKSSGRSKVMYMLSCLLQNVIHKAHVQFDLYKQLCSVSVAGRYREIEM